jgi:hypothetical protein
LFKQPGRDRVRSTDWQLRDQGAHPRPLRSAERAQIDDSRVRCAPVEYA